MSNILNEIAEYAAYRVFLDKREYSLEELKDKCSQAEASYNETGGRSAGICFEEPDESGLYRFGRALKGPGISVISELKKASPSKGVISQDFPYLDIAGAYERAGASCISCLTEPKWFLGSDDIFAAVRAYTALPMIRKDFVVDEYQIYQAKLLGADAVLLICALLDTDTIAYYLDICRSLRMDALVETHDESEISSALSAGARIIGVNNRNLKDFSVNFDNAVRLRELIPADRVYVAESGVQTAQDAELIAKTGADAVLIGEALMRADDREAFIRAFRECRS